MYIIVFTIIGVILLYIIKPKKHGANYDEYFSALNIELKANSAGTPVLVLDLDRLDTNIATLKKNIKSSVSYRVVAKSLPSLALIEYIFEKTQTNKLMVFHLPFIQFLFNQLPTADFLLGKPMPLQSIKMFYHKLPKSKWHKACKNIQWLVDTPDRLGQYLELAWDLKIKLRINLELDVGLHRGGISSLEILDRLLAIFEGNVNNLEFAGFMGYDPQVAKVPAILDKHSAMLKAKTTVINKYNKYIDYVKNKYPHLYHEKLTYNGAGSPTFMLYKNDTTLNDISTGSALMKPSDFDLSVLHDYLPALFIATPVIKKLHKITIPFIEFLAPLLSWWNPNLKFSYFIYGGYWKAILTSPLGIIYNSIYGRSSNQEIVTSSNKIDLQVDDYVFLRPTQSEAVMLQFGNLLILKNGKIIETWEVFRE